MRNRNPVKAFTNHKHHAKKRKIQFEFTFEEWINWWETNLGSDWFDKRGNKRGKYVMARFGDKGPYHPNNVKCVSHSSNVRERYKFAPILGQANHNSKLTNKDIIAIRSSKLSRKQLAKLHGVSLSAISAIINNETWLHV